MLRIALVLALGQTCTGTSCPRPAAVQYAPAPVQAVQEAHHAIYAAPGCSGQPIVAGRRKAGFRPIGKLFGGRRGGCG